MSNIFFIRHENDFEFMLPLIANESEPFIVLYGELPSESKNTIILNNFNYIDIYRKFSLLHLLYRILNKITIGKFSKFSKIYNKFLLKTSDKRFKKKFHLIPFKSCQNVIFDHTSTDITTLFVQHLKDYRSIHNLKFKLISVPHGAGTTVNTMCDYIFLKPSIFSGFDIYDKIICNDKQHFDAFIRGGIDPKKLITISSLRYTKYWVDSLLKQSKVIKSINEKINILIVHSKFIGNIDSNEVNRCLNILNNFKNLNLRIKSHPRGGLKEAKKLSKRHNKIEVVTKDIVGNIAWSDYVIVFGSSVVFDAFILKKPVLFVKYATSNQLSEEILGGVVSLNTPDNFYQAISDISNGNNIQSKHEYHNNYKKIVKSWENLLT